METVTIERPSSTFRHHGRKRGRRREHNTTYNQRLKGKDSEIPLDWQLRDHSFVSEGFKFVKKFRPALLYGKILRASLGSFTRLWGESKHMCWTTQWSSVLIYEVSLLRATMSAADAFLEAFQRVADVANSSRGKVPQFSLSFAAKEQTWPISPPTLCRSDG